MKNIVSLKYIKKFTFLFSAGVLFFNLPNTYAQDKSAASSSKETFRIKILKEKDGKIRMLDTTLNIAEFEKFKLDPGDFQDLLKEMQPTRILIDKLNRIELSNLKEPVPARPLTENEFTIRRKLDQNHFSADSTGRHIIILNQTLRPSTISPDSLRSKLFQIQEPINFKGLPTDSNRLDQIWLDKTKAGDKVKVYRLAPTSVVLVDTLRFTDNLKSLNNQTRIFAVRKVSIKDIEKQDRPIITKVSPPDNINLTEDLKIKNLKYYPNPNNGKFNLSFKVTRAGDMSIKIYDQLGREVHHEDYQYFSGDYNKEINMAKAERGVYFLKIIQGDSAMTKKLVID